MRALDENQNWVHVCDHCPSPHVMTFITSRVGTIELCWDCTKRFVPDYELELQHSEYSDHIEDAKARQWDRDLAESTQLSKGAAQP